MGLLFVLFVLAYPAAVDRSFEPCDQRQASWNCQAPSGELVTVPPLLDRCEDLSLLPFQPYRWRVDVECVR